MNEASRPDRLPQPWTVGEAVGVGWLGFRANTSPFVVAQLAALLLSSAVGVAVGVAARSALASPAVGIPRSARLPIAAVAGIASAPLPLALVAGGLAMMSLAAARGERARASSLVAGLRFAPAMLGYVLVQLLATLVPTFGLVNAGLMLAPFFIVDRRMGLGSALSASWRATRGHKGGLWLLGLSLVPARLVEAVVPIASLATSPVVATGNAYIYTRLTSTTERAPFDATFSHRALNALLRVTSGVSALAFAAAVFAVTRLPAVRSSAWTLEDALVRAAAIVLGTATTIALLATLLPWLLDRLEGRRGVPVDALALGLVGVAVLAGGYTHDKGIATAPLAGGLGLVGLAALRTLIARKRAGEAQRFEAYVAARHVRSQKSGFLTVISVLSICGVAISTCALSTVISVMGGFSQDLKRKILGNNAHIVVDTVAQKPFADYLQTLERVRAVPGVAGATPVVQGEVMMSSASNLAGVIVKGVDPETIGDVIDLPRNIEVGQFDYLAHPDKLRHLPPTEVICYGPGGEPYTKGTELTLPGDELDPLVRSVIDSSPPLRPGIIIGRELGRTLHVCVGDEVTLVSPLGDLGPVGVMPRTRKFRVAGIFYSGMYEYDASHVYATLSDAQEYFSAEQRASAIDVRVEDGDRADQLTPIVIAAAGRDDLRVRDWREMNKNLFSALKLERVATFVILSIAIMVASFCIICTLLLMVTEKGKEIAILKALGASDGAILRTFVTEGVIIGGVGTSFGVLTGLCLCSGLLWFGLRLNPDIYYIDRLPIQVSGWDFLAVAGASLVICTLSTIYPAYAASRLRPVDGLRYE